MHPLREEEMTPSERSWHRIKLALSYAWLGAVGLVGGYYFVDLVLGSRFWQVWFGSFAALSLTIIAADFVHRARQRPPEKRE